MKFCDATRSDRIGSRLRDPQRIVAFLFLPLLLGYMRSMLSLLLILRTVPIIASKEFAHALCMAFLVSFSTGVERMER